MLARQIPPTLEETAATLAELAVTDAAVQGWPDERERLLWLDFKLNRLTLYLFTMRVRYLFETRFYDARRRGPLAADELNELALGAEREVFGASLGTLHPLLWIENEDFYSADPPFYHFPYTAAYLFGIGLRARLGDGPGFSARYEALLRDTGRMTVDDLALKHLGVDLASTDFWSAAVDLATADVDHYLELSEGMLDGQRG
jgi:oligoendopeptidase F